MAYILLKDGGTRSIVCLLLVYSVMMPSDWKRNQIAAGKVTVDCRSKISS
jgi:hypothetical protein